MPLKRKVRDPAALVSKSAPSIQQSFVNRDAEQLYHQFVKDGQLTAVECEFAPTASSLDGLLVEQIERLGWQQLCVQKCAANVVVVREFYANAHYNRPGNVVLVRGKDVSFSPANIRRLFELPTIDNDDFHRLLNQGADYNQILQEMGFLGARWTYSINNPDRPVNAPANVFNRFAHA